MWKLALQNVYFTLCKILKSVRLQNYCMFNSVYKAVGGCGRWCCIFCDGHQNNVEIKCNSNSKKVERSVKKMQ